MKDPNVLETFQAGNLHLSTIMNSEDTDMDTVITTFNTAMTETACEIFGPHRQKKTKLGILDLFVKKKELRTHSNGG